MNLKIVLFILSFVFSFVKKSLERICSTLQQQGTISSFDEPTLKGAFSKEKLQREIEWQRLHPGMDAVLSHRRMNYTEKENVKDDDSDDFNRGQDYESIDSDEDKPVVPKKRGTASSGRGRGRGRGRGSSTPTTTTESTPALTMSSGSGSRWPPRR